MAIQQQPETQKSRTKPHLLNFQDMTSRQAHWDVDWHGQAEIPSAIPMWQKALSLSYQNFHRNHHDLELKDGTRMLAGNGVVDLLLAHYFSSLEFTFSRLGPHSQSIIKGVPKSGTTYFVVTWDGRPGARKPQSTTKNGRIHLIIAVITDHGFMTRQDRTKPTLHYFSDHLVGADGSLSIEAANSYTPHGVAPAKLCTNTCKVLLLAAKGKPIEPAFELYSFNTRTKAGTARGVLTPWAGVGRSGRGCNSFTFDEVEKIDAVFKAIVGPQRDITAPETARTTSLTNDVRPKAAAICRKKSALDLSPEQILTTADRLPSDVDRRIENLPEEWTREFVASLQVVSNAKSHGRIRCVDGWLKRNDEPLARGLAKKWGIKLQKIQE